MNILIGIPGELIKILFLRRDLGSRCDFIKKDILSIPLLNLKHALWRTSFPIDLLCRSILINCSHPDCYHGYCRGQVLLLQADAQVHLAIIFQPQINMNYFGFSQFCCTSYVSYVTKLHVAKRSCLRLLYDSTDKQVLQVSILLNQVHNIIF